MTVTERFLKYVTFETTSDESSDSVPSTATQLVLADYLVEELRGAGVTDAMRDEMGYVYGHIPASDGCENCPKIGLVSHMDTSPDVSGANVKPQIIKFDGTNAPMVGDEYIGRELIVTDHTTLLGADDKAGVAEIVALCAEINANENIRHGALSICFTPDEEIGEGPDHFNVKKFGAKFAYTMDGGEIGELEFENFNAANARIVFKGRNIHPGYAKNKMVNSIAVANEFMASLPKKEVPENTSGYEGFFHVYSIKGDVETTEIEILIRDFDRERFEWRKNTIENGVREFSKRFGLKIELELKEQYSNMREKIEPVHYIIDIAKQAMQELNIKPLIVPIRGGTDGARLSFMGLPTPNLFTGGHNFHGRYEYIPVYAMEKAVQLIIRIAELCTKI